MGGFVVSLRGDALRMAGLGDAANRAVAVLEYDLAGRVINANEAYLASVAARLDAVLGRPHGLVRLASDGGLEGGGEETSLWDELLARGTSQGLYLRRDPAGRTTCVRASHVVVRDAAGSGGRVVEFSTDVTMSYLRHAELRSHLAAVESVHAVARFDLEGRILDANALFLEATGYRIEELRGRPHRIFVPEPDFRAEKEAAFWAALASGQRQAGQFRRVGADGRPVWLQATYSPILDLDGRPSSVVATGTVVTEERARRADEDGQIAAIRKSQAVISFALDGTILDANENFLGPLGYTLDEVAGRHHNIFVEPAVAASKEYAAFWEKLRSGSFVSGLYRRIGRSGQTVWIQASYNPIADLDGRPYKIVKFATDVSANVALAEAYENARKQSQLDPVTALPNRQRLAAFMQDVLREPGRPLVLLCIDLDGFKQVNDVYGHDVGDYVLGQLADRLRRALSREQLAARLGADEFVIAAPDLAEDAIAEFGERLIESLSSPVLHEGVSIEMGATIGVATSDDADGADDLLRCADIALTRGKCTNRGGLSFYAASLNDRLLAFRDLVGEMRAGLEQGQFFVEFQPRFDTQRRVIRSVEALVRWRHPVRGLVAPADFIPAAEKSGVIAPLGAWVMREACKTVRQWEGLGVSVNVSPAQFSRGDLVGVVMQVLGETGLDPARLELEITEGILLTDAERARATLTLLKAIGVRIAMDDFGTGYSSLSSLRTFPFDVIKIDRQFITDMGVRPGGRETVQAILGLGRALGLSVTAEGVESDRQLEMLAADACDEVQGFLLARPMSAASLSELLARLAPAEIAESPPVHGLG